MLIRFFKSSYLLQYGLLVVLAVLLWLGAFLHPYPVGSDFNIYLNPSSGLLLYISGFGSLFFVLLAFFLSLFTAFALNYSLIKNDLIPANSLLPAFVYIVVSAVSVGIMGLNPILLSTLLITLALHNILTIYSIEDAYDNVFNSGFLVGLASSFYFPVIFFFFFIWITFVVFRLMKWREWVISFLGFITPYLFIWTWFFWNDKLNLVFLSYRDYFSSISFFNFQSDTKWATLLILGFIGILTLMAVFKVIGRVNENTIHIRKKIWALLWFSVIALILFFISPGVEYFSLGILNLSVVVFIAMAFSNIKRLFWYEIAFGLLVLFILLNNILGSATI